MLKKHFWILLFVFIYSCQHSENCDNVKKVRIGMDVENVIDVMGKPDSIIVNFLGNNQFTYMYLTPYGASDNVYVNFSYVDSVVLSAHGCE